MSDLTKADSSELELFFQHLATFKYGTDYADLDTRKRQHIRKWYDEAFKDGFAARQDQLYRQIMDGAPKDFEVMDDLKAYKTGSNVTNMEWRSHIRTVFKKGGTE